jgi:nucleoside phosphorylase/tetratricopeptide (TPR) repeat protein
MISDTVLGTVVICTALDIEYIAVREHLEGPFTEREERGTLYEIGTFLTDRGRWTVALAQTGAGNTQAGVQLDRAIAVFHPTLVLFVGVAGGRKDVALGDVVIADAIYDYESGKDTATDYLPRIKTAAPAHRLLNRAGKLARDNAWQQRILPTTPGNPPKAVIKPIAAGGKVIADQNSATALFLDRHCGDAAAVEMEGHGFMHGAYVNETVQALVVRGISDLLSGKTEAADQYWQPAASRHAAAFAFELLARHTTPPIPQAATIPQQLLAAPPHFIGRTQQVAELTAQLDTSILGGGTVLISALAGAGGIGKTWLALHWAHQVIDRFPDGQLFIDLHGFSPTNTPVDPADALERFLRALGVDPATLPTDLDSRAAKFRSLVAHRRMLILLDNAATTEQILPLLPGGRACTVLVTSRSTLNSLIDRHGAYHLNLKPLTPEEARALLTNRLGAKKIDDEPAAVDHLITYCRGFSLALALIASRASRDRHIPLGRFVAELREFGFDALDDDDPYSSLRAVLSWSYKTLTSDQQQVFGLLGIAPGLDISLPAAASLTGLSLAKARRALNSLHEASMLDRDHRARYSMHDLIRAYATSSASGLADNTRTEALRRVLDYYIHTAQAGDQILAPYRPLMLLGPPASDVSTWPLSDIASATAWFEADYSNLLAAQEIAVASHWHTRTWHVAWNLTTYQYRRGYFQDKLALWLAALNATPFLSDSTFQITAHRLLGDSYAELGRHSDAISHLHQALTLAEKRQNVTHQAHTHRTLARTWEQQGDDRNAFDHANKALHLYRTLGQPAWEAEALNLVGWYAARLGKYEIARVHCDEALVLHRHLHDPDGEAATLDSLGYIDHHTGHHRHALRHYQNALTLTRRHGNANQVADNLADMGHPYVALKQHEQAREVWQEAWRLYREQGRENDAVRVQSQLDALSKPDDESDSDK